jgi:O-antigen/teichoic acid export membrane protein
MMKKSIDIIGGIHVRIFGHAMSDAMLGFLKNISFSFFGVFVSALIFFALNVVAGRLTGPVEYGKYNLVLTLANVLILFLVMALDVTSIRNIGRTANEKEKKVHMANAFVVVFLTSFLFGVLVLIFKDKIEFYLGIDGKLILIAVSFAIFLAFKTISDSFIRGLHLFKFQAMSKILEGFVALIFFAVFFAVLNFRNYGFYSYALMLGMAAGIIWNLRRTLPNPLLFRWNIFVESLSYSKSALSIMIIITLMTSIDKLFVGKFLGARELGIYSAYLMATVLLASQIVLVLENVFFPMANKIENKANLINKIDKIFFVFCIPSVLLIASVSFIVMSMFGVEFEVNVFRIVIFSSAAFLQIMISLYKSIIMTTKKPRILFTRFSFLAFLLLVLTFFLMVRFHFLEFTYVALVYLAYYFLYFASARYSLKFQEDNMH